MHTQIEKITSKSGCQNYFNIKEIKFPNFLKWPEAYHLNTDVQHANHK